MGPEKTLLERIARYLVPERIPWFAARVYDRIAQTALESYYKAVAEQVVAFMSRGVILDIGTGPGYLPIEIAGRAPDLNIVGIDLSKALIKIARENAARANISDRVQFIKGDGNRLGFKDNSFDMVISTGALHAWKDPTRVFNECHRVLKGEGEAWILDPARVITPEAEKMMKQALGLVERLAYRWGSFTSKVTPPYSREEIEQIITRSAFQRGVVTEERWLTVTLRKGPRSRQMGIQGHKSGRKSVRTILFKVATGNPNVELRTTTGQRKQPERNGFFSECRNCVGTVRGILTGTAQYSCHFSGVPARGERRNEGRCGAGPYRFAHYHPVCFRFVTA
jgi:ubiquinone/menaquinone biosynthesis C-methylase UbiE